MSDRAEVPREEGVEDLARRWRVDRVQLSRVVNLAATSVVPLAPLNDARKPELEAIAKQAAALLEAVERASPGTLVHLLMVAPNLHPADLLSSPETCRQDFLCPVRWLAEKARVMADQLPTSQRPRTGRTAPPTPVERAVVWPLADLWHRTHGKWPKVTDHKSTDAGRQANEGGRFVIAAAQLVGLPLTAQRLGTVLASLKPASAETSA